jgi:hypothetical protein
VPSVLQTPIDRFARSLEVPQRLIKLHPRRRGNPGNAAALAPAVTLSVVSAFEGFSEEFFAVILSARGQSFGQIARKIGNWNNPSVKDLADALIREMPVLKSKIGQDFSLAIWKPPTRGTWWQEADINWDYALSQSEGWMQVRHCLSHGLATGWGTEFWPGPLKGVATASSVLRPVPAGKHSLTLHGAITCARLHVECARHLTKLTADEVGESYRWTIADFDLHAAKVEEKSNSKLSGGK